MAPAGEVKQAIEDKLDLIEVTPGDISTRAELAMIYQANAMPGTSIKTWNQIMAVQTDNPLHWYMLAVAHHDMGNYESAISSIATARSLATDEPQLWWIPAFWSMDMGRTSEAETLARESIRIDPDNSGGHVALALALMEQDRLSDARVILERIRRKVEHPYLRYLIGQTYRRQGQSELADSWLAQGDARQPKFPDPWRTNLESHRRGIDATLDRIDALLDQNKNDEAVGMILDAQRKWPEDVNVLHRRSETYRRKGDLKRWLLTLRKAEDMEPDNAATHLNLSMAYNQNDESSRAMTHAMRSIELNPSVAAAHLQMARLLIVRNDIPEAAGRLDAAFGLGVQDPRERLQYAHVLLRARRAIDAEKEARLVTRVSPDNALGWCVLAESIYAQGRREDAMAALQEGLTILPGNDKIMMIRGRFEAFEKQSQ